MITWLRDKLFGKNYGKPSETVNPQITDAVTAKKTTKTSTAKKVTKSTKTTKNPPVKKNTTRKTK